MVKQRTYSLYAQEAAVLMGEQVNAINVSMDELIESVERVEKGDPLTAELDQALFHGSSIGGARPKALIQDQGMK